MATTTKSTLVVGAGIIGLTCAWRLARHGFEVTVFDPAPGRGATWAAAGMIAPHAEVAPGERENFELQRGALTAWQLLAGDLERHVGARIDIHVTGTLLTAWDASDRRLLEQYLKVANDYGVSSAVVRRESHPEVFVALSDRITSGLLLEGDGWLDPDQAVRVLDEGLRSLGVRIVRESVHEIEGDASGVVVHHDSGATRAHAGIVATGAFGLPRGATPSGEHAVRPVRGMTVRVEGIDRSQSPTLRCLVRGRPFYVVSRPGGYCVLGASSEERTGTLVEVGELQRLLRDALDVVPALESASLVETRVGLRPASHDLAPFLEEWTAMRWAWSSGHYRHGVTLAPLWAERALDFVRGVSA
ncbi:MAG: FAD-dependent oxidoreductase [Acidobacteriota bacterium]|nr:FAD-dependent oxidoreductase [Acidobacteriota bacterium]